MSDLDKLLSVREAAALLGVHERSIYQRIADGRLPTLRLGRLHRIQRAHLVALLREGMADAGQEPGSEW